MNNAVLQWAGLIGSVLSLIGVMIALWQIARARRAAEAAKTAARRAHGAVTKNVFLGDVAASRENAELVKTYLRAGRMESALLRVGDLMGQLNQLKGIPIPALDDSENSDQRMTYREMLTNLQVIRGGLERRLADPQGKMDRLRYLGFLSEISDELSSIVGLAKYQPDEGDVR